MKKIGEGYYNHKGFDIYLAKHPKLCGKYEIYKVCDFISRAANLKEAFRIAKREAKFNNNDSVHVYEVNARGDIFEGSFF